MTETLDSPATPPPTVARRRIVLACVGLVIGVLVVYAPVRGFGFIDYDDPDYVTSNSHVTRGLSVEGLRWAFAESHAANWHPLTWLSHMLDVELFGVRAGAMLLVNVVIHAASACALLILLATTTGWFWGSFVTAAAFALHPLRVESVAWVSERKDLLSGLFFLLTLIAYAR